MENFIHLLKYFFYIMLELTVLILLLNILISFIMLFISQEKLKGWMSGKGIFGNIAGALLGALTPLWSFTTIPLTLAFIEAGIPFGAVMSFTIASPLLNPIIMAKITTLLGVSQAQIYFGIVLCCSVLFGVVLDKKGGMQYIRPFFDDEHIRQRKKSPVSLKEKISYAFNRAWKDYKHVFLHMLSGAAIGTAIYGLIPPDFVENNTWTRTPFAVPAAAAVGIPYFIRAETAIPIASSLIKKGLSYGAAIALIIGGAGIDIPSISMLASIFKRRLVALYIIVVFVIAVSVGLIFMYAPV